MVPNTSVSRPKLVIEGWRGVPHSYALVNHYQCLELLRRKNLDLFHLDVPYRNPAWQRAVGLFEPAAELAVDSIAPPPPGVNPDAVVRISFPFNYTRSAARRLFVFGTAERHSVPDAYVAGYLPLRKALGQNPPAEILTPSNWSRNGFLFSGAPSERVHVVPHGVDVSVFRALPDDERQTLRQRERQTGFTFLNVGAMTTNKGLPNLLKATAAVATRHPEVRLVMKGIDRLYSSRDLLASQASRLTEKEQQLLYPRISYSGDTLSDIGMAEMYQLADAYVTPYEAEGFNLPALEAAATGLPVIATAGGSTDDFLRDDFAMRIPARIVDEVADGAPARYLAPDPEALIAHMLTVIEEPEIRQKARETGPDFVRRNFTWRHAVDRLLAVILPDLAPAETTAA